MSRSAWTWAGPLAALTLAIAAGGVVLTLLTASASSERDFARFVPADVDLYVTLNLDPDHPQSVLRNDFVARWEKGADTTFSGDLLDSLASGLGVSYDDDIAPWLGNEIAFVGSAGLFGEPRGFLIARVADRGAAEGFLDYVKALAPAEADSYHGADILLLDDGPALGLAGDFMLAASSRSTLIGALRDLETPPSSALEANETYRKARAALPGDSFLFAFWQADATLANAVDALGVSAIDAESSYIAASASFVANGLRVEVAAPTSGLPVGNAGSLRSLDLLPADTIAATSFSGIPEAWESLNSTLGPEAMQDALSEAEQSIGLNIERDVIEALTGEVAAALLPSDFRIDGNGGWEGMLNGLLLAEVGGEAQQEALKGLSVLLEALGATVSREAIGEREFVFIPLGEFDPVLEGYELGYFVDDGMLMVASSREAASKIGTGGSLRESARFGSVADILSEPASGYVYIDVEGALAMAEGSLADAFGAGNLDAMLFDAMMEAASGLLQGALGGGYMTEENDDDALDLRSLFDALGMSGEWFGDGFMGDAAGFSDGAGMGMFDSQDIPEDAFVDEFMRALLSATDMDADGMEPLDADEFMRAALRMVSIGADGEMEPLDDELLQGLLGAASLGEGDFEALDGDLLRAALEAEGLGADGDLEERDDEFLRAALGAAGFGGDGDWGPFGALGMPEEGFEDALISGLFGAVSAGTDSGMELLAPFSALLITSRVDGDIVRTSMALTLR